MTIGGAEEHLEVHLVAHTHWDREWYRPAVQFQQRLVTLIDDLLDIPPPFPFLLDGQAVILEDYLAFRPERAAEVSTRLRDGSLEAGPWYVLADALIPAAESLVRNLLAGRRVLQRLRSEPPRVLYCPDSFGHPASLPTLAHGFDCPLIVAWRGYGGSRWPAGDTVRWRGADDSTALLHHLPPSGYEFGSHLPAEAGSARQRWAAMREVLGPRATTGVTLLPHGADHHAPQRDASAAINSLREAMGSDQVVLSSLATFSAILVSRTTARRLPEVRGELRDSYGYAWTLQGTFASRAPLKRRHALVERLLLRDVEPWAALARLRDGRSRRLPLQHAWRSLLLCQPHDTLCGCSVDEVARAAAARLDEAESAARGVRSAAIDALAGPAGGAADGDPDATPVVLVRNAAARARSGVAEIDLDVVLADAPVGPGSAGHARAGRSTGPVSLGEPPVAVQEVARSRTFVRRESPWHYPRNMLVERRRVLAWVNAVPPCGFVTLPLRDGRRRAEAPSSPAAARDGAIENGVLRILVEEDKLVLEAGGRRFENWIGLLGEGERGDLYTSSPMPGTRVVGRVRRARVTARGPLRAELEVLWEVKLSARRLASAAGELRQVRGARIPVKTRIQLDSGAPFVRVLVSGENRTTDARVRMVFDTALANPRCFADAGFTPVERAPIVVPPEDTRAETPPSTAPLHRWVSLFSADRGATLYSDGLAEYEATDQGRLLVTLLRAVGELSRNDLPERPGHAGYPVETPEAQLQGPFEAAFALFPHGARTPATIARISAVADDVLLPLTGCTRFGATSTRPGPGLELSGEGLELSAVKESEDGEWVVLRCVNLLDRPVAGEWRVAGVSEARLARLDETPLAELAVQGGRVPFEARAHGVVTIRVR